MKKNQSIIAVTALVMLLLISGCGNVTKSPSTGNPETETPPMKQAESQSKKPATPILMVIDQTKQEGSNGNSFYFSVEKIPAGYMLAEMQWVSDKSRVVNTWIEAIEHGANGDDGFYVSGNGQFSGFFYPDTMKGEKGEVIFIFRNEANEELTWKKNITLK